MAFFRNDKMAIVLEPSEKINIDDKFYFTSKDIIELQEFLTTLTEKQKMKYNIDDLVRYFNEKYSCNKILKMLKQILDFGIPIIPKLSFVPVTEACEVKNGIFRLSNVPYNMGGYYFVNNLLLVKYEDGTSDFFTDVKVDIDTLTCDLVVNDTKVKREDINGKVYVTYMTFKET